MTTTTNTAPVAVPWKPVVRTPEKQWIVYLDWSWGPDEGPSEKYGPYATKEEAEVAKLFIEKNCQEDQNPPWPNFNVSVSGPLK